MATNLSAKVVPPPRMLEYFCHILDMLQDTGLNADNWGFLVPDKTEIAPRQMCSPAAVGQGGSLPPFNAGHSEIIKILFSIWAGGV